MSAGGTLQHFPDLKALTHTWTLLHFAAYLEVSSYQLLSNFCLSLLTLIRQAYSLKLKTDGFVFRVTGIYNSAVVMNVCLCSEEY